VIDFAKSRLWAMAGRGTDMFKRSICIAGVGAATLFAGTAEGSAACTAVGAKGVLGAVAQSKMSVPNGERCALTLVSGPANGEVNIDGHRIIYAAKKGYVGTDNFSYRTKTRGKVRINTYNYAVAVDVY
jgi:Bacterial Ig domain